jgi:hypothetical protein
MFEIYLHGATGVDSPVVTLRRRCAGCWTDHPARPAQWMLVGHGFIVLWTAGISKFSNYSIATTFPHTQLLCYLHS